MRYTFLFILLISGSTFSQEEIEIVDFPDKEAEYPGGSQAMKAYIQTNVRYPQDALQLGQQGKVYLQFIVEINGSLSDVRVVKSSGVASLDREAIRTVRAMPKWKPGMYGPNKVRVRCRLPITFTIDFGDDDEPKKKKRWRHN